MRINTILSNNYFLAIIMVIGWLITGIGLPLSIFIEFKENYLWLFYFKLYPHMILFPLIFFGLGIFSLYQAIKLLRNRVHFTRHLIVVISISLCLSIIESNGNNMMLFEFNKQAESIITIPRETIEQIQQIPNSIIDTEQIINNDKLTINKEKINQALQNFIKEKEQLNNEEKQGYYQLMEVSLSYDTWKKNQQNFSLSRWFYLAGFFIITSISLMEGILLFLYNQYDVNNYTGYIYKLAQASVLFTTWIPLRFYYNLSTKNIIFGYSDAIGSFDFFAFIIYPVFFIFLLLKIYQIRRDWFTMGMIIFIVTILTLVGRFDQQLINITFGLNSNPLTWLFFLVPSLLIVYIFNQRANSTMNH